MISQFSSLVVSICSPVWGIVMITISVFWFAVPVTWFQVIGYSISVFGLLLYRLHRMGLLSSSDNSNSRQCDGDKVTSSVMCHCLLLPVFLCARRDSHGDYVPIPADDDDIAEVVEIEYENIYDIATSVATITTLVRGGGGGGDGDSSGGNGYSDLEYCTNVSHHHHQKQQ